MGTAASRNCTSPAALRGLRALSCRGASSVSCLGRLGLASSASMLYLWSCRFGSGGLGASPPLSIPPLVAARRSTDRPGPAPSMSWYHKRLVGRERQRRAALGDETRNQRRVRSALLACRLPENARWVQDNLYFAAAPVPATACELLLGEAEGHSLRSRGNAGAVRGVNLGICLARPTAPMPRSQGRCPPTQSPHCTTGERLHSTRRFFAQNAPGRRRSGPSV